MSRFAQYTLRVKEELNNQIINYRVNKMKGGESFPSMNEILIELIEAGLNGHPPEKIVSKSTENTDSEQKKEDPQKELLEIVSDSKQDTDSDSPWNNVKV